MAKDLLAELDTDGNGSLAASEFQTAIDQMSSVNGDSSVASTDEVFAAIDANEDGEVTESELSDTLQTIADSLDFAQGMSGMPPPPPPAPGSSENDTGFTEEELTSQLAALNESDTLSEADTARAELLTNVLSRFETVDADGDSRVTFQETMALEQSTEDAASGIATTESSSTTTSAQGMGGPGGPGGPGGMGGPPPSSSDSESDSSQIIAAADTNEDGTVSLEELIAYNQASQASSSATTDSATSATSSTPATATESTSTDGTTRSAAVMHTIMQLVQSYGATDQTSQTNQLSGLLSLSA
ncbi:hypothetical protein CCR95_23450 [Thiocystis minor]|uniref:EF-hand domain-containing protein n=1 Tax=Thiocystis minor TaxID=61597 RepID=UPI0019117F2B|nr:EF-hand domain-containing protein [Thiocystis minor]MBK5966943.1 hypothetical protein [Thiocystis minor]